MPMYSYSSPTHNDFNAYSDKPDEGDPASHDQTFEAETEYDRLDWELIPADDSLELLLRMSAILCAVTVVTMGFVWLLLGGFGLINQSSIAEASVVQSYPTSTLIGQSGQIVIRAGGGALARTTEMPPEFQSDVQAGAPAEQQPIILLPAIVPTVTPLPAPLSTPIPPPVYNFNPDRSIQQSFVTDKMATDLESILHTDFPARDYLTTHLTLTDLVQPEPNSQADWLLGQRRTINVIGEQVEVRLVTAGTTAYIWVDSRLSIPDAHFNPVVTRLDQELYPAVTSLFGEERSPGIDADPRFHIFHLARLESKELGYFDSSDSYPKEIFAESNEHEAIYINMDTISLGDEVYYGTLVHEMQHLIQWNVDRNETTWLDEGMAQLSEVYVGFNSFSVDNYTLNNDVQLNDWSYDSEELYSHYGGSALFVVYLWEQFGDSFIRALSANRYDGMAAVSDTIRQSTSQQTVQTVFRDWLIAVYLNDDEQAEAKYGFSQYEFEAPIAHQVALANNSTTFSDLRSRPQFSGWYVELPSNQEVTVSFAGDSVQSLFPSPQANSDGTSGTVFFAPPRNRVDSTLQKTIDLSGLENPSIRFDTWYDMEEGYDHVYLMVSADGGINWEMLSTPEMKQGTYGPGYSGMSAGWISQSASLSQWSGLKIIVQFQMLTDSAVSANGFAIDNIKLDGEGTVATFEFNDDGWIPQGFVRTGSLIPQLWTVSLVQKLPNGDVQVTDLDIDRYGEFQQTYSIVGNATLIVAPVSPLTNHPADFWLNIQ